MFVISQERILSHEHQKDKQEEHQEEHQEERVLERVQGNPSL